MHPATSTKEYEKRDKKQRFLSLFPFLAQSHSRSHSDLMPLPTATAAPTAMAPGTHRGAAVPASTAAAAAAVALAAAVPPAAANPPPAVSFATLAANSPPSISPFASFTPEDTASIPPEITAPAPPDVRAAFPSEAIFSPSPSVCAALRPVSLRYDYDGEQVQVSVLGIKPLETPLKAFAKDNYAGDDFIDFR